MGDQEELPASAGLLVDAIGRVRETVHTAVDGLDEEQLAHRVDPRANSIAWLVWHLTRIEDDHVAGVAGSAQVWHTDGWVERFALPFERDDTGFGHSAEEVAGVRVGADLLAGYHDAVHARTVAYLRTLADGDLAEVVDTRWDPPVTRGTRLVSVVNDTTQHAGQAAFVRGLVERRAGR